MKEKRKPEYTKFQTDNTIVNKKYLTLNSTFMTNFNKGKDIQLDNSNLKYNQMNTIDKYGLIYFYNESGIYFMDNSKLKHLKVYENKDISYTDLFFIKCENIFNIFLLPEKDEKIYLIICTKNIPDNSFLFFIAIENLIKEINKQNNIYNIQIIKNLEDKEQLFSKGYFTRALDELEPNVELNENGEYEDKPELKKLTPEEKLKQFMEEKKEELRKRNEIFEKNYEKSESYEIDKIIYLDDNYEDVIVLDYDNYIMLYNNGDIIFYNNYKVTRIFEKKAIKMSYNKDNNIFLILSKEEIFIFKEQNNFETINEKKPIVLEQILFTSLEEEKIIHIESIFNFIIFYSIENKEEPENSDKLYFLQMNANMDNIEKIYLEKNFYYPDEYELDGLAYENHLKRTVFTIYDKDINVYFVFNKHMDLLNKYYCFKKRNDEIYDLIYVELNDDEQLNSRIKLDKLPDDENIQKLEINPFIGISIIKFKFDGYNDDYEIIKGEEIIAPYLLLVLGYYGGIKLNYIVNEAQKDDKGNIEYKLMEQNNDFRKTDNISNKSLKIKINIEKAETEKENFMYNIEKTDSIKEMLNRKTLNLRNIFLHEFDLQIKENLDKINKSVYSGKISIDLINLGKISKGQIFEDIQKSIKDLIKNAKELIEHEEENELFIKHNKEITQKNQNLELRVENEIKRLEDKKNKFKELSLGVNSPIKLILTNEKMKSFFGENEINFMIKLYNEVKNNINIFQNITILIEKMNEINLDLIKDLENCKKNYISKKEYDCLKKRKDFDDVKKKIQNNIFIMYMKTLYSYYWNLYQFKEKEMTEELNNLNELKRKHDLIKKTIEIQDNKYEDEKNEDHINIINNPYNNKKRKKFILKEEEDIDEGNNNIQMINIDNLNNINNYKEQRLILASDRINNDINRETLIERKKNSIVNKLFNTNLVKEKEYRQRNKLSEILSNFEGRVSLYDESNDEECIDSNELFADVLIDEQQKKLEEKKLKAMKEKQKKEKDKKFNYIKKALDENEKEREDLIKIEEEKNAEIKEKDKQIKELKHLFEETIKKFEDNKKEREKEKKIYEEEIKKSNKEGIQKINEEKNKQGEMIKKYEKDLQEKNNKLLQNERKIKELEEKMKKLEEENKNIIQNNNINNNINNNQIQNKFLNIEQNKENNKKDEKGEEEKVFEELGPAQSGNFTALFTSNMNDNKKEQNNNVYENVFKTTHTTTIETNNIFAINNKDEKPVKNLFDFNNNSNNQSQNQNQNQSTTQNNNNNSNNLSNQPNINKENPPNIFKSNNPFGNIINIPNNQGQTNTTNFAGQNSTGFGQHRGIGQNNDMNNRGNTDPITLSFGNIPNNQNNQNNPNNQSPFISQMGNSVGLFGNIANNQNNPNNQSPFVSQAGNTGGLFANNQNGGQNQSKDNYF